MAVVSRFKKGSSKKQWRAMVSYHDVYGKRHNKTSKWFDAKEDAKTAERLIASRLVAGATAGPDKRFEDACLEWIEATKETNTKQTYEEKLTILDTYLSAIKGMRLRDITPSTLKRLFADDKFSHLSTSRKNRIRGMISSTFKYYMATYNYENNPCDGFPTFKKTTEEKLSKEYVIYNPAQFKQMAAQIDKDHWEYRNVLYMLYLTGARLNEALSITFRDIQNGRLHIWRQWKRNEGWVLLKSEGSDRSIALNRICLDIVAQQRAYYQDFPGFSEEWFVFGGPKKLAGNTVRNITNDAQTKAGLPHCRLHDLRHAHASVLLDAMHGDGDILKVSKRLGHSSVTTTLDIYAHLINDSEKDTLSVLDSLF